MTGIEGWTPEQIQEGSVRELQQGRLPLRAQQRLATMREDGAFTSSLSVDEHHAIRTVGFSPVGQVMGSCVYQMGYTGMWNCGYRGSWGGYQARTTEATGVWQSLYESRALAVSRMVQECAGLGGDGVVAVRLGVQQFPAGGLEFTAIGTAVRADGPVRPRQPFTSALTGQDFAKLIFSGWVPTALLIGLAVMVRHDDYRTRWQTGSWYNTEVAGFTELVHAARATARVRLRDMCARSGGDGVVVHDMSLHVGHQSCSYGGDDQHDHLAESMVIGTAITPFGHAGGNRPVAPLPMMRLR